MGTNFIMLPVLASHLYEGTWHLGFSLCRQLWEAKLFQPWVMNQNQVMRCELGPADNNASQRACFKRVQTFLGVISLQAAQIVFHVPRSASLCITQVGQSGEIIQASTIPSQGWCLQPTGAKLWSHQDLLKFPKGWKRPGFCKMESADSYAFVLLDQRPTTCGKEMQLPGLLDKKTKFHWTKISRGHVKRIPDKRLYWSDTTKVVPCGEKKYNLIQKLKGCKVIIVVSWEWLTYSDLAEIGGNFCVLGNNWMGADLINCNTTLLDLQENQFKN